MLTSCATQEGDNQVTSIVPLAAAMAPELQTSLSSNVVAVVVACCCCCCLLLLLLLKMQIELKFLKELK